MDTENVLIIFLSQLEKYLKFTPLDQNTPLRITCDFSNGKIQYSPFHWIRFFFIS